MFKRLGRFAVLAVCLFAIAIVMVGCGPGEEETPMEKLAGTYTFIGQTLIAGGVTSSYEDLPGNLHLMPEGNGWSQTIDRSSVSGPTWSATDTTLTTVTDSGVTSTGDYTLVGKVLTLVYDDDANSFYIEYIWQKE